MFPVQADDGECRGWLPAEVIATIDTPEIDELSGLVGTRRSGGALWAHNDSGGESRLYALDDQGGLVGEFFVPGVSNVDWEDIAIGPCGESSPECSCLVIADIGNNDGSREGGSLYRLVEPDPWSGSGQTTVPEVISFVYPDGPHDAEALLIHPITGETVIVTKASPAGIYTFGESTPEASSVPVTLVHEGFLVLDSDTPEVTGGDVSELGYRIALRTDGDVFLYDVQGQSLVDGLRGVANPLPGPEEQNAEAVAFSGDGRSLFLAGEEKNPELWTIRCASFDLTAETSDPLLDCASNGEDLDSCGCRGGSGAAIAFFGFWGWRKRRLKASQ